MTQSAAPQAGTVRKANGTVCPATRYAEGLVYYSTTTALDSYTARKAPAKLAATFTPKEG